MTTTQPFRRAVAATLLVILSAGCGGSGCATGGVRHQATNVVVNAHTTLGAIQDGEMALVCGRPGAPREPACVPVELHRKISGYLVEAFEYDGQVASLVRDVPEGKPTPVEVLVLIGKIGGIVSKILNELPKSPQQEALAASLGSQEK
jgi:hypothetical protein